jgi:hypothetical protein
MAEEFSQNAPRLHAEAKFSVDMAETLLRYFDAFQIDGVVTVEVTDKGLWLKSPDGEGRQFLGSTTVIDLPLKM